MKLNKDKYLKIAPKFGIFKRRKILITQFLFQNLK